MIMLEMRVFSLYDVKLTYPSAEEIVELLNTHTQLDFEHRVSETLVTYADGTAHTNINHVLSHDYFGESGRFRFRLFRHEIIVKTGDFLDTYPYYAFMYLLSLLTIKLGGGYLYDDITGKEFKIEKEGDLEKVYTDYRYVKNFEIAKKPYIQM